MRAAVDLHVRTFVRRRGRASRLGELPAPARRRAPARFAAVERVAWRGRRDAGDADWRPAGAVAGARRSARQGLLAPGARHTIDYPTLCACARVDMAWRLGRTAGGACLLTDGGDCRSRREFLSGDDAGDRGFGAPS